MRVIQAASQGCGATLKGPCHWATRTCAMELDLKHFDCSVSEDAQQVRWIIKGQSGEEITVYLPAHSFLQIEKGLFSAAKAIAKTKRH